jgi:hypothetical protein
MTQNFLFNDYLTIRAAIGDRLPPIQLVEYFLTCYEDIPANLLLGVDMTVELCAWEAALAQQDKAVQQAVRQAVKGIQNKYSLVTLGHRIHLRPLQRFIREFRKMRGPLFHDIIAAEAWLEQRA